MKYLNNEQEAALKRNGAAAQRVILNIRAHDKILEADTYHKGIDFIQLAYRALFNDSMAQAINIFDGQNGGRARSFWWLYRQKKKDINGFAKEKNLNWEALESISKKLHTIRNGTHFHFSHQFVNDYKEAWKKADINGNNFLEAIYCVWEVLSFLHQKQYSEPLSLPDYDGEDAKKAAKFVAGLGD